jgi:Type I restriction modification DNA specificity domain
VPSSLVASDPGRRLDATFYNRGLGRALAALQASGMQTRRLGDVTKRVFMPTRFKRTYVSADHGVPFLQGSHVVQFRPADVKYLSRAAHKNLDQYLIRRGWLLVTRSGSTGRVALVPPEWDGWAASEHVFRVIPEERGCPAGYLATFLESPIGQAQLSAQVYGAVVDELTEEQVRNIEVPMPSTQAQRRKVKQIDELAWKGLNERAAAVRSFGRASAGLNSLLPDAG